MTDDEDASFWQAQIEQEQQEREAADALEYFKTSGAQRENKRAVRENFGGDFGRAEGDNLRVEGCDKSPF